jgi:extracellular elastinolytic metalloproteinase
MSVHVDVRSFAESRLRDSRSAELRQLATQAAARLSGTAAEVVITRWDATTGNAAAVRSVRPQPVSGDLVAAALRHAYAIAPAFGLASTLREFTPDPAVQGLGSGGSVVHLHQRYKGVPVFQAELTVIFAPDRSIAETVGSVVAVESEAAGDCMSAADAVLRAARDVARMLAEEPEGTDQFGQPWVRSTLDVSGFEPTQLATFPGSPEQPTVFAPGPFDQPVRASLLWFPLGDEVQLGWDVVAALRPPGPAYRTIVSATSGDVLYSVRLVHGLTGTASVYPVNGGGALATTQLPVDLDAYGVPRPDGLDETFPQDWLDSGRTEGCFAVAYVEGRGEPVAGVDREGVVAFEVPDPTSDEQKVVNLFYYACLLHDVFYALGFREADGNFQSDNASRGGIGNDRVDARVSLEPVPGTARFVTPPDGGPPVMDMGPVPSTGRHCAFDATVVFHEFTHGVSSRLIGGPLSSSALLSPQSAGIAEGISDFFACALNDTTVVGDWVVNDPRGIRRYPYDADFPDGFDKIGTGRYRSSHAIGEVCAALLMELMRRIGKPLALQLVVDAMKLTASNPGFLNLRDAVLAAGWQFRTAHSMGPEESVEFRQQLWSVFARFGLGPKATSHGAQLSGITADFDVPEVGNPPPAPPADAAPTTS